MLFLISALVLCVGMLSTWRLLDCELRGAPSKCMQDLRRTFDVYSDRERTSYLLLIAIWLSHQQRSRLSIQWISRVRIQQELRQEDLENIEQV